LLVLDQAISKENKIMTLYQHQSRRSPWWRSIGHQIAREYRLATVALGQCFVLPLFFVSVIALGEALK
jgi:hypothetical protein